MYAFLSFNVTVGEAVARTVQREEVEVLEAAVQVGRYKRRTKAYVLPHIIHHHKINTRIYRHPMPIHHHKTKHKRTQTWSSCLDMCPGATMGRPAFHRELGATAAWASSFQTHEFAQVNGWG